MKPGRSHRRYFSSDLKGTVLKIFLGVGRGGIAGEGKAQTDRHPLTHIGGVAPAARGSSGIGARLVVQMRAGGGPPGRLLLLGGGGGAARPAERNHRDSNGQVHPGVGYWLAAAGYLETGK